MKQMPGFVIKTSDGMALTGPVVPVYLSLLGAHCERESVTLVEPLNNSTASIKLQGRGRVNAIC
jgi:hypothetical protein